MAKFFVGTRDFRQRTVCLLFYYSVTYTQWGLNMGRYHKHNGRPRGNSQSSDCTWESITHCLIRVDGTALPSVTLQDGGVVTTLCPDHVLGKSYTRNFRDTTHPTEKGKAFLTWYTTTSGTIGCPDNFVQNSRLKDQTWCNYNKFEHYKRLLNVLCTKPSLKLLFLTALLLNWNLKRARFNPLTTMNSIH